MPSFKCSDRDMPCPFETSVATEAAELMTKIAKHASEAHSMGTIPRDVMKKVKKAIER